MLNQLHEKKEQGKEACRKHHNRSKSNITEAKATKKMKNKMITTKNTKQKYKNTQKNKKQK